VYLNSTTVLSHERRPAVFVIQCNFRATLVLGMKLTEKFGMELSGIWRNAGGVR